jgi:hypothetical protein
MKDSLLALCEPADPFLIDKRRSGRSKSVPPVPSASSRSSRGATPTVLEEQHRR